jgi:hypothetical protein
LAERAILPNVTAGVTLRLAKNCVNRQGAKNAKKFREKPLAILAVKSLFPVLDEHNQRKPLCSPRLKC